MIYGFDTSDEPAATGALLVYAVYRSRDRRRYKVTPDIWEQIERFAKDSAKRSRSLPAFIETLKPRLHCGTVHPRWMAVGAPGDAPLIYHYSETGTLKEAMQFAARPGQREFLTSIFERADARAVLRTLYGETAWIIMLVRDRLEREKPIEDQLEQKTEEITDA